MAGVETSAGKAGRLVVKFQYDAAIVAALKQIPGRQWNPTGKFWTIPDTPAARAQLTQVNATPPQPREPQIEVKPKSDNAPRRPRRPFAAGKPLTTNPPHPLIKAADDELVLRGMAYGTRKSYGQQQRNYFEWLNKSQIVPEQAARDQIREYLVQLAQSGTVSAAYCRGARAAIVFLYATTLL